MDEYIERVPFAELVEHLNKKEPCKNCYHMAACDAWIRNATTLYDDYDYSVENCPYYKPTADVVKVVRCKDCGHSFFDDRVGWCEEIEGLVREDFYCALGEKVDVKGDD